MSTIAIYARKSKFSEKSESVANQVALSKEYCDKRFDSPTYLLYDEDEGFSGKNTNRPSFQRLMKDLRENKFETLICYRLDRVSRSVSDFSSLLDDMQRHGVAFISLRENFDTSTPMGRAMVYISSVFAQLERETLSERVRDNLHELAKTGRWLGGNTPLGYGAITLEGSSHGKARTFLALTPIESEIAQVRDLFQRFVELGSVCKLLKYCLQCHITSRAGVDYSRTALHALLANPTYATADSDTWAYYAAHDHNLCATIEDFDGIHGIQPFNRTSKTTENTSIKPTSDWIISVGRHVGAISGSLWVKAQNILEQNRELGRTYQSTKTEAALLSGVIRCASCGGYMRPKLYGKPLPDGGRRYNYVCELKDDSRGARCSMPNAPGHVIDPLVIQEIMSLSADGSAFSENLVDGRMSAAASKKNASNATVEHEQKIIELQRKLDNVMSLLSDGVKGNVKEHLLSQVDAFDCQIKAEQSAISELSALMLSDAGEADLSEHILAVLSSFGASFNARTHDEKRRLIRSVVDAVYWDGKNVKIDILGAKTLPK